LSLFISSPKLTCPPKSIRLYILGGQLEIVGVKNAAIDAVYAYFNDSSEILCPNLHDVQQVFENTPPDAHMRRLLIAHALFYLFSKKPATVGLPEDWAEVMQSSGQVGWAMVSMLNEWRWEMGVNVPPMKIKTRQSFHEPVYIDLDGGVKHEEPMQ